MLLGEHTTDTCVPPKRWRTFVLLPLRIRKLSVVYCLDHVGASSKHSYSFPIGGDFVKLTFAYAFICYPLRKLS